MKGFIIKEVYCVVSVAKDGDEGVIGVTTPAGYMPAVCADLERLKDLLPSIIQQAREYGFEFKVIKLSVREDVTTEMVEKYGKN